MRNKRIEAIRVQVSRAYNVFNRYGRDANALADMTRAFIEDLDSDDYKISDITKAFAEWRKISDAMPTSANIIYLLKNPVRKEKLPIMTWADFQQKNPNSSFSDFREYYADSMKKYASDGN